MSKTTAQQARAAKPTAKKPPPVPKAAGKAPVKSAAKSAKGRVAAPATKAPTKAAAKKAAPAAPAAAKKTPAKPASVKSRTTAPATVPAPKPAAAPTTAPAAAKAAKAASAHKAPKTTPEPATPPAPSSTHTSSRFADRFAPPKPPTRQMNNLTDDIVRAPHKADPKLANAWKFKAGRDLTEAELLSMPDSEYMNEKQLDFFRARLQGLKDDLLSNAGETTEHLREDTTIVPDPADRATIEEEHALELRTRDRERKLLKKISQSLARIESGDYGFCDETGEPIGLGRLIARPTATLSLEAQQRRELKQKMFGD